MRLYTILLILALVLTLLQSSALPVFGVYLNIMLALVATVVYVTPSNFGGVFAFLSGLMLDLLSTSRFGTFTLMYTLLSSLSYLVLNIFGKKLANLFFIVLLFAMLEQILFRGFSNFENIFLQALVCALMAVIFYPGINKVCEKFGGFRKKLA